MKVEVYKLTELEIHSVRIEVELHDDVSEKLPKHLFNDDGELDLLIEVDTGKVVSWQGNEPVLIYDNVADGGVYTLFDNNGKEVQEIDTCHIPNLIPSEYGDYINLYINADGFVSNWPKNPSVIEFFTRTDDYPIQADGLERTTMQNIKLYECPADAQSAWISVADRLPENNSTVIVFDGTRVKVSPFLQVDDVYCFLDTHPRVKVTHWQPLPEPPK